MKTVMNDLVAKSGQAYEYEYDLRVVPLNDAIKAMKLYANAKLDEASEKAKYKYIEINGHLGSSIIEDSILSLKDQI